MRRALGLASLGLLALACGSAADPAAEAERAPAAGAEPAPAAKSPACDADDGGLKLPEGFCGRLFAEDTGPVRNLVVSPEGFVYATLGGAGGGVLALRDDDGDARADVRERLGGSEAHGIALTPTHLYVAHDFAVVRHARAAGSFLPDARAETIVDGFPRQGSHAAKAIALAADGALYVEVGAPSNACQKRARRPESPGFDPCPQRELQSGIWRYAADRPGQRHEAAKRYASGLRHALALAVEPVTGAVWAAINGRDQLGSLWGYSDEANAELPAEEMVALAEGDDLGWPYCYHDGLAGVKVLAPEYGGDGTEAGRCADAKPPDVAFPAHWAPMAIAFYTGDAFPARYRGGAFVAFRGSWNRAPLPQEGYRIAFVPFAAGRPSGTFETFAIGRESPTGIRFTGVAVAPDGALYLAADANGKVWRVQAR